MKIKSVLKPKYVAWANRANPGRLRRADKATPSAWRRDDARRSSGAASSRRCECTDPRPRAANRTDRERDQYPPGKVSGQCPQGNVPWASTTLGAGRGARLSRRSCLPACPRSCSNAGPTFAKPSKIWLPPTRISKVAKASAQEEMLRSVAPAGT
jgi:hypothetical protein